MSPATSAARVAVRAGRVITCVNDDAFAGGAIDDGVVVVEAGRVAWIGRATECPAGLRETVTLAGAPGGGLLTPGLVDAHTHAAFVGSRHAEYAVRMAGGDYEAIAKAGGGILSSHRAIAAASEDAIAEELCARLARMAALGVTTVEVKSGYGLTEEHELKQLRAIARAASKPGLPRVVPTFLALHALPPNADRAAFVETVVERTLPAVAEAKLARFVDAYVDRNAFRVDEARLLGVRARSLGLDVRLHVGQFADIGGAALAAELSALSVDHVEHVGDDGAAALAKAGVTAVLLPIASFTLAQAPPDVALLRRHGVPLAVASDANPGTAPTESLPLAMALAARLYGLSTEEIWLGVTRRAAASLALPTHGQLKVGAPADLTVWDLPHEAALLQPWGSPRAVHVMRDGVWLVGGA